MAAFIKEVSNEPGTIELGVQGENNAEGVAFDVTQWSSELGAGTAYIYHQRKGEAAPYFKEIPVATEGDLKKAIWTFSNVDTGVEGDGVAQLLYIVGDTIKKTQTYITVTKESLGEAGETPDPYEDLLQTIREIYQLIVEQREAATGAAQTASGKASEAAASAQAAAGSAQSAAQSAELARNVFQVAGDVTFAVAEDGGVHAIFN